MGGTFISQNKIRPGAYLNYVSVSQPQVAISDRGIAIIPLSLSWGATDKLIEVLSTDLDSLTGTSLATVGFTAFDNESKLLSLMLRGCYKALVFRINPNGTKASADLGDLTATAIYPGLLGNHIQISITGLEKDSFEVKTFVKSRLVDSQIVTTIAELTANNFVKFSGTGDLQEFAGELLSDGTDGAIPSPAEWLPDFLEMASIAHWQTMAVPIKDADISKGILNFIDDQRNNQGRYVQAVVCDYDADHEGIINSTMGVVIDGVEVQPEEFVAWVAGVTAGAPIVNTNERPASNTARIIEGATDIIGELNNEGIISALKAGKFILSRTQDNRIKVEQDINSFTSWTQDKNTAFGTQTKNKVFSKNRVLRTLDEIGVTTKTNWENFYMGKHNNDDTGRALLKGDLIAYFNELQRIRAIENFAGTNDIIVEKGNDSDSVIVDIFIQPVDSMEKLYMTVNVTA